MDVSSDGKIIQLLPNEFQQGHLFKACKTYIIPEKNDTFKVLAKPPYGADKIVVYAGEVPLGSIPMKKVGNGLHRNEKKSIADFYEATRIITNEK